jgi:RNA polymerase sigma-70 factor (ECF subfamily)
LLAEERSLLATARAGDPVSFAALVTPILPKLLAVAGGMVGQDAPDVVQEALVDAFRGLPEFRGESRLATWLIRLTVNRARAQLRRRPPPIPDGEVAARLADWQADQPALDPELAAIRSEDASRVWDAVHRMPENLRMAVVLHDAFGLAQHELTELTGWPLGTAKSNVRRGRALLVSLLGDGGAR